MRNKTKEVGRRYFLREFYIPGLYPLRKKSSLSEGAFQDDQICIFESVRLGFQSGCLCG